MNLRPSGYEPDELPGCSTPRQNVKRGAGPAPFGGYVATSGANGKGEKHWFSSTCHATAAKSDNDGDCWGTEEARRLRDQLGACHDLAVLTRLTAPRGEAFVKKWGLLGIFIGRFFGPLNASSGCPAFSNCVSLSRNAGVARSLVSRSWPAIILSHRRIISR